MADKVQLLAVSDTTSDNFIQSQHRNIDGSEFDQLNIE